MMWRPLAFWASAIPRIARLSASVPPLRNTIDRDQHRIRANGPPHVFRIDQPIRRNVEPGDLPSLLFEVFTGVKDGMVLNLRGNDVASPGLLGVSDSTDRQVVRLSSSAEEYDRS